MCFVAVTALGWLCWALFCPEGFIYVPCGGGHRISSLLSFSGDVPDFLPSGVEKAHSWMFLRTLDTLHEVTAHSWTELFRRGVVNLRGFRCHGFRGAWEDRVRQWLSRRHKKADRRKCRGCSKVWKREHTLLEKLRVVFRKLSWRRKTLSVIPCPFLSPSQKLTLGL